MSKARAWPNNAKFARDRAAEETEQSIRQLKLLLARVQRGEFTRAGLERDLLYLTVKLQEASRHLQSAGAPIRPE